jgi:hypothetical protein
VVKATALALGGSDAGGSAAVEVLECAVVFVSIPGAGGSAAVEVLGAVVVFVSTPGAVSTSILAVAVELNLVGVAWDCNRVDGDNRVDVTPRDLAAGPPRLTAELDEWLAALPNAKAGTTPMITVAAARTIPRGWGMASSHG